MSGSYKLRVRANSKAGWLRPRKPFETTNDVEVWPEVPSGTVALSATDRVQLQHLVAAEWVGGAAKLLGVSRTTMLAGMGGSGIRRASAEMISRRLLELVDEARKGAGG